MVSKKNLLFKKDTDINDDENKVRQDADVISLPAPRLRCRPEQSVDEILTKSREQSVANLQPIQHRVFCKRKAK